MANLKELLNEKKLFEESKILDTNGYFYEEESELKETLKSHLIEQLKKKKDLLDKDKANFINLEAKSFFDEYKERIIGEEEKRNLIEQIKDDIMGYGPITPLLADKTVTEIMVNGPRSIYIEQNGKIFLSRYRFSDEEHIRQVIEKIVLPLGRRIDEGSPMVDARLPDGSRVNAIIPPLALNGSTITIRKFSNKKLGADDLIKFGSLSTQMAKFLNMCVKSRLNIFISGGTGSGKTTLLNVLSSFIPEDERIVTIEDAAELKLQQDHVISLETRPANIEGLGEITIRDLVKNSLRMRPDRVIVGEVRAAEALDMLQAMNTGHDGSLATGHSNSPKDMLRRLETMVLMSGMELPSRAIREQLSSAVDIIVQVNRLLDGSRKIVSICEIVGIENDQILTQDIFKFNQTKIDELGKVQGNYDYTGIVPGVAQKLTEHGLNFNSILD